MPKSFEQQVAERLTRLERAVNKLKLPGPMVYACYYNSATDSNVTGDGTSCTPVCDTEVMDIGSNYNPSTGIFTAPYTGLYVVLVDVLVAGLTSSHIRGRLDLIRTGLTFYGNYVNPYAANYGSRYTFHQAKAIPMSAGQTVYPRVIVLDGAKVVDVYGAAAGYTVFQAFQLR